MEVSSETAEAQKRVQGERPWHAVPVDQTYERLVATKTGLTSDEASRRFEQFGPNVVPTGGGSEALKILVRQFRDPLIYVLVASTALAMVTGKLFDGLVILGVIVLNAIIGFVQEYRASKAIKALSTMVPAQTTVLRDGRRETLPASGLVPGDVVLLQSGDKASKWKRLP